MMNKKNTIIVLSILSFISLFVFLFVFGFGLGFKAKLLDGEGASEVSRTSVWGLTFLYRLSVYFVTPLLVFVVLKVINRKEGLVFKDSISKIFEIEFIVLSIISSIYLVFALDVLVGVTIFNTSDAFLAIVGLVLIKIFKLPFDVDVKN